MAGELAFARYKAGMTDWSAKIFAYCERALDPSFWAEPLNAATNAAFLVAAAAAFALWRAAPAGERRWLDLVLIAIVLGVGVGSFLFHTFATRWAAIADVAPITLFMVAYLIYAVRRFLAWNWLATLLSLALFIAGLYGAGSLRCAGGACLNGSLGYAPALAALLLIGALLWGAGHPAGAMIFASGLVFAVSLAFRTLDRDICAITDLFGTGPVGTHFIWHFLNAVLLYLLLRAAIRHGGFSASVRHGTAPPAGRSARCMI
jgi:hypothetical protein